MTRNIVFFGASLKGKEMLDVLLKNVDENYQFLFFVDNDQEKWGQKIRGYEIKKPSELHLINRKDLLIFISSMYQEEIAEQLRNMNFIENQQFFAGRTDGSSFPVTLTFSQDKQLVVNLAEKRGFKLFINKYFNSEMTKFSRVQANLNQFWVKTVEEFIPTVVVDVGLNYGEGLFSTIYKEPVDIIGIEPNPYLIDFIRNSIELHPNKNNINVVEAIASNGYNEKLEFFVNEQSGLSGLVAQNQGIKEIIYVQSIKLDDILLKKGSIDRLLFKIDVEGHEPYVLEGMSKTISSSKEAIGFVEFDSKFLDKQGINIQEYLNFLFKWFLVEIYQDRVRTSISKEGLLNLTKMKKHLHTDLVLIKK
ncbi:FkbM family methyltransferase [Alkalihalobacillus trypoxylicola]|uniref:Methyltransferase FkbM domain-containing protein n=1 Tax=Alkalihalobacillus trypoxylicola TaxID=519424 RepID=A0A162ETR9_9BACI|nr:FkbM family methyltransferase [Alkalihalobacillus trypoxylicola]KYG33705.1 hypothetical protein AZF04_15890 [Alkalihalobacillus trypoxylicola]